MPRTLEEFLVQHLGVASHEQVAAVAVALDKLNLRQKIGHLVAAYNVSPESFGPFRVYRAKIWRLLILSSPTIDFAVCHAMGTARAGCDR